MKLRRANWLDRLAYRLFVWRWSPIFSARPDLREIFITNMKMFDLFDPGEKFEITVRKVKGGDAE